MKLSTFIFCFIASCLLQAQTDPAIGAWLQNTTVTGTYYVSGNSTQIDNNILVNCQKVEYSDDFVYITATGIPAYPTGPFEDGNQSNASDQEGLFKIPLNPTQNTGNLDETVGGNIGVFINGVALYDYRDGVGWDSDNNRLCGGAGNPPCGGPPGMSNSDWKRDAVPAEMDDFDCSKAHPGMGNYHHHQNPSAFKLDLDILSDICNIYDAEGLYAIDSTQHSPLIGYAYDGFPIYGAYGYKNTDGTGGITRILSSYALRNITRRTTAADGSNVDNGPNINATYFLGYFREDYEFISRSEPEFLDEHNGRFCLTPEYPNGTYAYFATVQENWNSAYPYVVGPTFYGHYENRKVANITEATTVYTPTLVVDADGDTFNDTVDCNDNDPTIYPGAEEICDGQDNNCDGVSDEGFGELEIETIVGMGFIEINVIPTTGVIEYTYIINGLPTTSNGPNYTITGLAPGEIVEITVIPIFTSGSSGIGCPTVPVSYIVATLELLDNDGDGFDETVDCNDNDDTIYPGAIELCDDLDNDCDANVDEGFEVTITCPPVIILECGFSGNEGLINSWLTQAVATSENGAVVSIQNNYTSHIKPDCGEFLQVIFAATSDCMTESRCISEIQIYDSGSPTHTGLNTNISFNCDNLGNVNSITNYLENNMSARFSDACSDNLTITSNYDGSTFASCSDIKTVLVTVEDDCNNSTTIEYRFSLSVIFVDNDGDGVTSETDCNDNDNTIYPGAPELCDGYDNNCNGSIDEDVLLLPFYRDSDQDGYGNDITLVMACRAPAGYVELGGDCNDADANINPIAMETCDSIDNNCNGQIDEGLATTIYYLDTDMDGYGADSTAIEACLQPFESVTDGGDCNDLDFAINPGATEIPNNDIDENCDGVIMVIDTDGDGFNSDEDCDDQNAEVYPGNSETPYNGLDDDCDPMTLDDDLDQDGYLLAEDCDDENAAINPDAIEIPNNDIDEDCDGEDGTSAVNELTVNLLKVFPNPAYEYVTLQASGLVTNRMTIKVFAIDGQLIATTYINQGSTLAILDVRTYYEGKYVINVSLGNSTSIQELIIAR